MQPVAALEPARTPWRLCYNAGAVKEKIHPKWYPEARVHCACGNSFVTGSTLPEISVEIVLPATRSLPGSRSSSTQQDE